MNKLSKDEFADLVIQNKIPMYRLAMGILKNNADAEDAVSETILIAYEHLYSLKDKTKFKSWMMTMLVNESKRVLKRRKKAVLSDNADLFTGAAKESNHEILDLVMSLKEEFSQVVILYYYEGFTTKEIAKILRISEGTVKSRLSRARTKLKQLI